MLVRAATAALVAPIVARHGLDETAERRLGTLLEIITSDPLAPTTVRDPQAIAEDHLADSLVALDVPQVAAASRIADIGSGAGFPGLPLAIVRPDIKFALVESNGRKCDFLRRAAALTSTVNAEVIQGRVEESPPGLGVPDVVVARALAPLAVVLEYAAPVLPLGGTVAVWRGRRDPEAEAQGERAAVILGLEATEVRRVHPYSSAMDRFLHLFSKVSPTPDRFPRRPGVAVKRPLGD